MDGGAVKKQVTSLTDGVESQAVVIAVRVDTEARRARGIVHSAFVNIWT